VRKAFTRRCPRQPSLVEIAHVPRLPLRDRTRILLPRATVLALMTMKRGWTLATLCLSAIATTSPATADCSRPRTSQTALKQADFVCRGTVRELETAGEPSWIYAPFPKAAPVWNAGIVTLDVSRVWKGSVGKRFVLHVARTQVDDAFDGFLRGFEYVVFAQRNSPKKTALFHHEEPTYGATGCGGTTSVLNGMMYLIDLGPGKSPE
jgi:hypothetical protein